MDQTYRNFYRNFYRRTGGYIPAKPLTESVYPGDFFQIRNGEMIILGNIFREQVIEPHDIELAKGNKLNSSAWHFSEGVTKPYSGRAGMGGGPDGAFEYSKQILAFGKSGHFIFRANNPESVKILNWEDIQQQLIVKMTQSRYSFRQLYIVTESVTASDWTLAIAGSGKAELEIATEAENFGLTDIFGHPAARTIQSKGIDFCHHESNRKPVFLKAKKLVIQDRKLEVFISELVQKQESHHEWAGTFFNYAFQNDPSASPAISNRSGQSGILDMLPADELNPATALQYFRWEAASLDDIEQLFAS